MIISLTKSEITNESISVCNVTEKFMENDINYLPCSYINHDINVKR